MIAIDTNIYVYRFDQKEPAKQAIAKNLVARLARERQSGLLWQVAGELLNQLTYWQHQKLLQRQQVVRMFKQTRKLFPLVLPTEQTLDYALLLRDKYSLQHWDSMLLGACLEAGVTTLYTEDMGAPRKIDTIELINPF
jgi:predicted nucleic acid-binding protein